MQKNKNSCSFPYTLTHQPNAARGTWHASGYTDEVLLSGWRYRLNQTHPIQNLSLEIQIHFQKINSV